MNPYKPHFIYQSMSSDVGVGQKRISKGNQDMTANTSYEISKQSPKDRLEIKHKMSVSKLRY